MVGRFIFSNVAAQRQRRNAIVSGLAIAGFAALFFIAGVVL